MPSVNNIYLNVLATIMAILLVNEAAWAKDIVISTFEGNTANTDSAMRILEQAYKEIGRNLIIKKHPGERAVQTANAGLVDGELYRKSKGLEKIYPNLRKIPVSILSVEMMVFTTKKINFEVKGWESLRPYRVSYMRGAKIIEKNLVEGTIAETTTKDDQSFLKLNAGWVDVVVTSRRRGMAVLKKLDLPHITMLKTPVLAFESCHYLHKKNEDLIKPLTAVLQKMEADGTIKKIHAAVDEEWRKQDKSDKTK